MTLDDDALDVLRLKALKRLNTPSGEITLPALYVLELIARVGPLAEGDDE